MFNCSSRLRLQVYSWFNTSSHGNFQILKQFLRGCKFSLERSKEKLDNFHLVKGALPEWFDRLLRVNWLPTRLRVKMHKFQNFQLVDFIAFCLNRSTGLNKTWSSITLMLLQILYCRRRCCFSMSSQVQNVSHNTTSK